MANTTLKFGNGNWAIKEDSALAYSDQYDNFKPLPFDFSRASSGTIVNKEGLIESVNSGLPRIDFSDSADGALLLEPQSTNLINYSEDFLGNGWILSNTTATPVTNIANPFGDNNCTLIEATGVFPRFRRYSFPSGDFSYSIFVKSNTSSYFKVRIYDGTDYDVVFNLDDGTFTEEAGIKGSMTAYGNGWYRCGISINASAASTLQQYVSDTDTGSIYVRGAQLEVLPYATSYIPTNGSTVTRSAETANGSGNSEVFNDSEGVLFADVSALADDGTSRRISLTDVSGSAFLNLVSIELDESSGILKAFVSDNSDIGILQGNIIQTQYNKIALKYNASSISLYVNGFELDSNNTPNLPSGLKILDFNNGQSNQTSEFYGKTKEIVYYDTALTDEELETLTSYRSLNELVTALKLNTL